MTPLHCSGSVNESHVTARHAGIERATQAMQANKSFAPFIFDELRSKSVILDEIFGVNALFLLRICSSQVF